MSLSARAVPVDSFSFPLFRGADFTCLKKFSGSVSQSCNQSIGSDHSTQHNPTALILFIV
jgi:hypothetical protein